MRTWGCFLIFVALTMGCGKPTQTFETDALCHACVTRACESQDPSFETHVRHLSAPDQAQMIAQMESHPGCMNNHEWAGPLADNAYATYGSAFFADDQPWYEARGQRAWDAVAQNAPHAMAALGYLDRHFESWRALEWVGPRLAELEERAESDAVFALLVRAGDRAQLERLCAMDPTPFRNEALMTRWPELPDDVRQRAMNTWVYADWSMQTSGSAQLPQYLVLDWMRRPLPDGVPGFVAALRVESIRIQNAEVKRGTWRAIDAFTWPPLTDADSRHGRVDLSPWLNAAGNYRISARAVLDVWPEDAPPPCYDMASQDAQDACETEPLARQEIEFDRTYRVFLGVDTGAPHRQKDAAQNARFAAGVRMEVCNDRECLPIWDGQKTAWAPGQKLDVEQGHDFFVRAHFEKPSEGSAPGVGARLMARAGEGRAWREIATFYGRASAAYPLPSRGDIDLGDLCGRVGPCALQLQLRPSLRMARRDPRIDRYWGSTLELGTFDFEIHNLTVRQMWSQSTSTGRD